MSPLPTHPPQELVRVLLVEDNVEEAEAIRVALGKSDRLKFEITRAVRLRDALQWAAEVEFDAVLLDVSVPFCAPAQAVAALLEVSASFSIICVADREDEKLEKEAFWLGAQGFVYKGEHAGLVTATRQAIERGRAHRARERRETRTMHAQKIESLQRIAAGVARDFDDLIVSILGNSEVTIYELPLQSPLRSYLSWVESAGQRAAELMRKLGTYAGKAHYDFEVIHVSRLICDLSRPLRAAVDRFPTLVYETSSEQESSAWIAADIYQLRQAILNILTNCAESVSTDSGVIIIRTGVEQTRESRQSSDYQPSEFSPGDHVYIEIRDDGCGIAPEALDQVCDPFYTTKDAGRGLGLTVAAGIIRSHKGSLRVRSTPGNGTTIRILLPCVSAARPSYSRTQLTDVAADRDSAAAKRVSSRQD